MAKIILELQQTSEYFWKVKWSYMGPRYHPASVLSVWHGPFDVCICDVASKMRRQEPSPICKTGAPASLCQPHTHTAKQAHVTSISHKGRGNIMAPRQSRHLESTCSIKHIWGSTDWRSGIYFCFSNHLKWGQTERKCCLFLL